MKILKILLGLVFVIVIVLAVVAPIGPLPGFFIGGNETATPSRWMDTSETHEIKLKVPGVLPRVVIIWVVEHEQALYVVGSSDSGWVRMLGDGGDVKMRLDDDLYSLAATRVREGLKPILASYIAKYETDYPDIVASFPSAVEDSPDSFAVFRLN